MSRHRLAVLAAAMFVLGPVMPAAGQQSPPVTAVGNIGKGFVDVGLGGPGGPAQPAPTPANGNTGSSSVNVVPTASGGGGGTSGPPLSWVRTYPGVQGGPGGEKLVGAGTFCLDDAGNRGVNYLDNLTNTQTGEVVSTRSGCATSATPAPNAPANGMTTAQPAPTPAEIWARTPLATPSFGINPADNGLTGLPTWLWDPNGGAPINATVQLRGYTATVTASPVRWSWTMGGQPGDTQSRSNPAYQVVSSQPGSAWQPGGGGGPPAAKYTYETKGDYTLSLTVTWAGSYTYTGAGGATTAVDLGTTTKSASRPYTVIAIGPVLTATPS